MYLIYFQDAAIAKRREELIKERDERRAQKQAEKDAQGDDSADEEDLEEEEEEDEEDDIEATLAEEFEVRILFPDKSHLEIKCS